jgi:hypothetical protein
VLTKVNTLNLLPPPLVHVLCTQEAEEFAEQDKAVKARVDAKNQLETYAYNIKSTVEDKAKDKVRPGQCIAKAGRGALGQWLVLPCWGGAYNIKSTVEDKANVRGF